MSAASVSVTVEGRRLALSNLDKVLYPATGFTKAQVIDYYSRIAPVLLPHLKNKPLTLKRYPDGVDGQFFFEKACPSHRPEWVNTAPIWSGSSDREIKFCLCNDLPTLVWLANLAALELHPSLALADDITQPRSVVFDLDPGAPADIVDCCRVGLWARELFEAAGLQSFAKTSGSKGLQVYVPLNTPTSYEETKPFALAVAQLLERQHAKQVVSNMKKELRTGKVFIDWSQNDEHKTTVSVYSLRARERQTVSTPVTWDEVEGVARSGKGESLVFEASETLLRMERLGDLFEPLLELKQTLPKFGKTNGARQ